MRCICRALLNIQTPVEGTPLRRYRNRRIHHIKTLAGSFENPFINPIADPRARHGTRRKNPLFAINNVACKNAIGSALANEKTQTGVGFVDGLDTKKTRQAKIWRMTLCQRHGSHKHGDHTGHHDACAAPTINRFQVDLHHPPPSAMSVRAATLPFP